MASYTYSEHDSGCKCCRLEHGDDLPIPKELSYDEIAPLARKFSHDIFADWIKLNAILKRFEAVIQKRWTKKGLNQRREILVKAFPDIPTEHRPDFASFRNTRNRKTARSATCSSAAFLRPYINLEDLQKQHLLLKFLNSRGRNSPRLFLESDIRSAHIGRGWEFREETDKGPTETSKTMHMDRRSPLAYGRLVLDSTRPGYHAYRTKNYEGLNCEKMWDDALDYYHPRLGLLGLEIQHGIYSFLLACAEFILHDIEHRQFFLAPFTATPAPLVAPRDDWPSLTAHQLETPYCVPQKLDLDRIRLLVASRRESAEDNLWLLKEDPAYFVTTFEDWAVHDAGLIYHPCSECKQRVVAEMVSNGFKSFILWDFIHRKLEVLTAPDQDQLTWTALLWMFDELQIALLPHLSAIRYAPRMRGLYDILNTPEHSRKRVRNRDSLKDFERRVVLLFNNLLDPGQRKATTLSEIVQEIQHMLDTDANASRLVDSWITGHFSDLALVTELKFRVEGLRPWVQRWRTKTFKDAPPVKFINEMLLELLRLLEKDMLDICNSEKNLIGDPADGRFNYPISKAYTKSNVDQLRCAESLLDKFWENMERGITNRSGLSIKKVMLARVAKPRTIYRTPAWTAPSASTSKARALADISTNVPRIHNTWQTNPRVEIAKPREKVKTRGTASTATGMNHKVDSLEASNEPLIQKIGVPKRAYKVLAALFPGPSAENHQRAEVAWPDFLHAMDAIGLEPQKLYGSVWMLRPKASALIEAKRSIQFHEPKEVRRGGKIPANMVRVFGRRLKHAYGWEGDMFESM